MSAIFLALSKLMKSTMQYLAEIEYQVIYYDYQHILLKFDYCCCLYLQGIMSPELSSLMFLIVGISMALTPWLAAGGQLIASRFELHDVRSLLPVESEVFQFFFLLLK